MSLRFASLCFLLLGACALRPRYGELTTRFVPQDAARTEVLIQVLDRNDAPVSGARIEIGDRYRFKTVTDADGVFRLPLDKKLSDENDLVVVVLPKGIRGYHFVVPGSSAPPLVPTESIEAPDAGVTTM